MKGGWRYISNTVMAVSCDLFMSTYLEIVSDFDGVIPWSRMLHHFLDVHNYQLIWLCSWDKCS